MFNKLFNLFGYHVVIVSKPTAESIYNVSRYWSKEIGFDSETDQTVFEQVAVLFK